MLDRVYIACDLKSFYASVECIERGLDPLTTNLVVADKSRTEKTICLAVSPSLKAYGVSGRARLFEVVQKVAEVNAQRRQKAPKRQFTGSSWNDPEVKQHPELALDYLAAPPRMAHYIEWSTKIYNVYLKYVAPSDIHVYSIDEVLMDVTNYLPTYKLTPKELARKIVLDVLNTTGITATAGIGPNLYLAKVAMDIWAKHTRPDKSGVRIAELDELSYRKLLWEHRPLTDFWRVGRGYAKKLEGQVLTSPYDFDKARMVAWEMADQLALDLVGQRLVTDQLTLTVGYDIDNLRDPDRRKQYKGAVTTDRYGRQIPKHAHGTANLDEYTASAKRITAAILELFDRIVNKDLLVRRLYLTANRVAEEGSVSPSPIMEQLDLLTDEKAIQAKKAADEAALAREKKLQETMLGIKSKFGKNAILKGTNLMDGATAADRNGRIGGHKA
ncbi:MAG: DNA methylase [Oscillospiraceae bacterium]|nr:DNA methylase [Oscillospiraceae bacterium]